MSRTSGARTLPTQDLRNAANPFLVLLAATLFALPPARADEPAPAQDIATKVQVCEACHGAQGNSSNGTYPILAGQNARYLYLELRDFKEGRRKNELMSPMAAGMSRQDMQSYADWFAKQPIITTSFKADPDKAALGKKKTDETLCTMCHLGAFAGQNEVPRVAGQQPQYVIKQLTDFKHRTRTNDAGNMTSVSQTLNDDDIENIANYIATLY